jgi:hypothetical protein
MMTKRKKRTITIIPTRLIIPTTIIMAVIRTNQTTNDFSDTKEMDVNALYCSEISLKNISR